MGLELRAIQSPIFSEPFDFTFHVQAFTLLGVVGLENQASFK